MIGMLVTPIKVQLGPLANGLVIGESFVRAPPFEFPGVADLFKRYQAKAPPRAPMRSAWLRSVRLRGRPSDRAGGRGDQEHRPRQARRLHPRQQFKTVVGDVAFGKDGEWTKSRQLFTQFQDVAPNDLDQFRDGKAQPILWPAEYKTGKMIYPYGDARKK